MHAFLKIAAAGLSLTVMLAATESQARGGGLGPAGLTGGVTIPSGQTVGPQTIPGGNLTNNGTIAGGSHTAVTSTGPMPATITNNGTITSSTGGISATGGSSTITNNGAITVSDTVVSTSGTATATGVTGILQTTGP